MIAIMRRPAMRRIQPLLGLLALSACATNNAIQHRTASAVIPTGTLPAPDPRSTGGELEQDYYIGPMDKLDISVYSVPELTRTIQVDSAGKITLPFAGTIVASRRTAQQVRDELAVRLTRFLQHPEVTVSVNEATSQKVTVEGAVAQPGVYSVSGKISLVQAIAIAKGTNNVADEKLIAVFRTINQQRMAAVFDLEMIRDGRRADPDIYGNDVIVVERSRGKVILRDVIGTLPLLGIFRTVNSF